MADRETSSMRQAAAEQAKREGRAWLIALLVIGFYWGIRLWLV